MPQSQNIQIHATITEHINLCHNHRTYKFMPQSQHIQIHATITAHCCWEADFVRIFSCYSSICLSVHPSRQPSIHHASPHSSFLSFTNSSFYIYYFLLSFRLKTSINLQSISHNQEIGRGPSMRSA